MKFSIWIITAITGIATAAPSGTHLNRRQTTANDIKSGGACKKVTLIFARASTEPGNMVKSYLLRFRV
jgi:hypothetical protein